MVPSLLGYSFTLVRESIHDDPAFYDQKVATVAIKELLFTSTDEMTSISCLEIFCKESNECLQMFLEDKRMLPLLLSLFKDPMKIMKERIFQLCCCSEENLRKIMGYHNSATGMTFFRTIKTYFMMVVTDYESFRDAFPPHVPEIILRIFWFCLIHGGAVVREELQNKPQWFSTPILLSRKCTENGDQEVKDICEMILKFFTM